MRQRSTRLVLLGIGLLSLSGWMGACAPATASPTTAPTAEATATRMPARPTASDWLIVDVPENATQLVYGAEVYRLTCQDCHGDKGQGLTAEWRATWAPEDQNCWQSRCHGPTHPPEGFVLPVAPAVVGPHTMQRFGTAKALHDFIQQEMPWYKPGSLVKKDAWAVTAYILQMNRIDPGENLSDQTAAEIQLK